MQLDNIQTSNLNDLTVKRTRLHVWSRYRRISVDHSTSIQVDPNTPHLNVRSIHVDVTVRDTGFMNRAGVTLPGALGMKSPPGHPLSKSTCPYARLGFSQNKESYFYNLVFDL